MDSILGAVAAATRGTDIAGWLEERVQIGVLLSDIEDSELQGTCEAIENRLRSELASRVDPKALGALSIAFHTYPEPRGEGEPTRWPMDPILYPDLRRCGSDLRYEAAKRTLDILVSLTLLGLLSPLLLIIAILVKLGSPGTVLFRQVRVGRLAKPFTMLKFRTMYAGADDKVHQEYVSWFIQRSGEANGASSNGVYKLTNDRRVTRIGNLLRKTSLDELPQLWNVLRGDMSLVGPRPPLPYELEQYATWHRCRVLEVMPGITGLWQVTGRSLTTFDEMVRLDLRYVRARSFWMDLRILLATPMAVLSGKGAC
jgi:lipopolysaccharide/colanic/teichoic acid biosynthesis glycosyltransferase